MLNKITETIFFQTRCYVLELFRYKVGLMSDVLIMVFMYIAIYLFNSGEVFKEYYSVGRETGKVLLFIGYIFWQLCSLSIGFTTSTISNDLKTGTIEIKIQSIYSMTFLIFVNMFVLLMGESIIIISILCFFIVGIMGQSVDLVKFFLILLFTIPSIIGTYGMGLLFGAIAIREKSIGSFITIIQSILLFLSNVFNTNFYLISVFIPFYYGVDISRKFYLGLKVDFKIGILYILLNALWFIVGKIVFDKLLFRERRDGCFEGY